MASSNTSSLRNILHADPAAQNQPQHQHPHQHQGQSGAHPQPGQSQTQDLQHQIHLQNGPPSSVSQSFSDTNSPPGLAPISAPGYSYPPPPSTVSPAASGTDGTLVTPATSPTATSAPASANGSALPKGHATNSSLYQCAHCLKKYSRPEHLQRHIASHTLGKRFVCDVCSKAFGRADLLKRHRTNHDDDSNGTKRRRINSSPGAGRVAHACVACARARVKCEELKPCTRCRNRGMDCEYASTEAGSAAAMHLMHLATGAPGPVAPMGPTSHQLGSAAVTAQMGQHTPNAPMQGLPHTQAALAMTNPAYTHTQSHSNGSSPSMFANQANGGSEAAHLPTPEDQNQNSHQDNYRTQYSQGQALVDMSKQQFGDFLQHVLYDQQQQQQQQLQQQAPPQLDPSTGLAVAQGLAVLDFCNDANLDMNDMDFGMLDNWNLGNIPGIIATDPNLANYLPDQSAESADMSNIRQRLVSLWRDSPWQWQPDGTKDNIQSAKNNLPLGDINSSQLRANKVVNDKLHLSGRDKILSVVLSTCQNNVMLGRVSSSFPSIEVMDSLVQVFLAWHQCQVSGFIHLSSLRMVDHSSEWLAVVAAAGAILTPVRSLRKFGFALQEAVRVSIPNRFEDNNQKIQDPSLVQALVLGHDIGLWSGNRRRMEIAECHLNIPIAMTRGRGLFTDEKYPPLRVDPSDEGAVLESKWKLWIQRESWKRLIFHLFVRDAQMSMTSMTNPHISYSELTLPLPEARELWFADTAQEWKMHYLERNTGQNDRPLSLLDLLRSIGELTTEHHRLDLQFAVTIFLHGFWGMIREYRQMSAVFRWSTFSQTMNSNPNVLLETRHQELVKTLELVQSNILQSWPDMLSVQENVVLNLLLMNLHVSLEDLQLFSGKEGEARAKQILPALQRWVQEADSRRAIWHAGQILRWAREFPIGHLKDFYAVAVHHAALAIWTWGVVTRSLNGGQPVPYNQNEPPNYLDAHDAGQMVQFVTYGRGRPVIRGAKDSGRQGAAGPSSGGTVTEVPVDEPRACMGVVEDIFKANFLEGYIAPIVENLCQLVNQLGKAAGAVGLG